MSPARSIVHSLLGRIRSGRLEVIDTYSGTVTRFGPDGAGMRARIEIHSPEVYSRLLRQRSVGMGESYAEGAWDCDDLVSLFRIAAREISRLDRQRTRLAAASRPLQALMRSSLLNTRSGARANIAAHYDLGNQLFEQFLDRETMLYSCALFDRPGASLEDAQLAKLDRICERLELDSGMHLLEIGTGWGGLAVHAAGRSGCRVTTTTISGEQREYAEARVRAAGLEGLVTVLGADYRDLRGQFDRLVSIEMIEAVGWQYFDEFFRRCSELLKPDGLLFLQAICMNDRAYEAEKNAPSFANRMIFPGGCLPSQRVIAETLAEQTEMRAVWLEDISPSYALTLEHWRRRFRRAEPMLAALGYDERFRRLWELYLSFSEAGFREARISVVQTLAAKPGWVGAVGVGRARAAALQVPTQV